MTGWQPVAGYEDRYEVSDAGEVRNRAGAIVSQWLNSHGYPLVRLSGPRAVRRVHRLVAEAFIPNPEAKPFVNHLNNDRSDNRAVNLEWVTQAENLEHMTLQGRRAKFWTGKRSPNARLSDATVAALRERKGSTSLASLGREFGVSKRTVGRILCGESYNRGTQP